MFRFSLKSDKLTDIAYRTAYIYVIGLCTWESLFSVRYELRRREELTI
jgi:hypothetical protein